MNDAAAAPAEAWISEIVHLHTPALTCYARSIVHSQDSAQDCVQDTFIRMVAHLPIPEERIRPWLFKVCRNRCLDWLRKEKRMKFLGSNSDHLEDPVATPDRSAELSDSTRTVIAMLDQLPQNQQEVLRLKYQSGMSYQEIATVTGRSVSHVGVILHEGMLTIRRQLRRHSDLLETHTR